VLNHARALARSGEHADHQTIILHLEPVRGKVEFEEALVIFSPALVLRRRTDVES